MEIWGSKGWSHIYCEETTPLSYLSPSQGSQALSLTQLMHRKLHQTCFCSLTPRSLFYHFPPPSGEVLTTSVLITVVPAVVVSVTLPLGGDAGTLAEGTHCAGEVAPTTGTLGAAGEAWTEGKGTSEGSALTQPKPIPGKEVEEPSLGPLSPRRHGDSEGRGRPWNGDFPSSKAQMVKKILFDSGLTNSPGNPLHDELFIHSTRKGLEINDATWGAGALGEGEQGTEEVMQMRPLCPSLPN